MAAGAVEFSSSPVYLHENCSVHSDICKPLWLIPAHCCLAVFKLLSSHYFKTKRKLNCSNVIPFIPDGLFDVTP